MASKNLKKLFLVIVLISAFCSVAFSQDDFEAENAAVPAENTAVPADDAAVPDDDAVSRAEITAVPAEDAAVPADDAADPADDAAVSAEDTAIRAEGSVVPAEDSSIPADDASIPADDARVRAVRDEEAKRDDLPSKESIKELTALIRSINADGDEADLISEDALEGEGCGCFPPPPPPCNCPPPPPPCNGCPPPPPPPPCCSRPTPPPSTPCCSAQQPVGPCDNNYCGRPAKGGHCTARSFSITSIAQLQNVAHKLDDGLECIFWAGKSPSKILPEPNVYDVFLKSFCPKFGHSETCLWRKQNIVSASCDSEMFNKYYNILYLQNGKRVEAPVTLTVPSGLRCGEYSDGEKVELTDLCTNVFDTCPFNQGGLRGSYQQRPDCFAPPCECPDPKNCRGDITLPLQKWSRMVGTTANTVIFLSKVMLKTKCGLETVAYYAHESNNCEYLQQFPQGTCISNPKEFDFKYPCTGCTICGSKHLA